MICRIELLLSAHNFVILSCIYDMPVLLALRALVLLEGRGRVATVGQANPPLLRFGTMEEKKFEY